MPPNSTMKTCTKTKNQQKAKRNQQKEAHQTKRKFVQQKKNYITITKTTTTKRILAIEKESTRWQTFFTALTVVSEHFVCKLDFWKGTGMGIGEYVHGNSPFGNVLFFTKFARNVRGKIRVHCVGILIA